FSIRFDVRSGISERDRARPAEFAPRYGQSAASARRRFGRTNHVIRYPDVERQRILEFCAEALGSPERRSGKRLSAFFKFEDGRRIANAGIFVRRDDP